MIEHSEELDKIVPALLAFQRDVAKIKKNSDNPYFKSKYANLSTIQDVIREPLQRNNLCYTQHPVGEGELQTILFHASGQWFASSYSMPFVGNVTPQVIGSQITYQRRYALSAILGLNIDDETDDDGNLASHTTDSAEAEEKRREAYAKAQETRRREREGVRQKRTLSDEQVNDKLFAWMWTQMQRMPYAMTGVEVVRQYYNITGEQESRIRLGYNAWCEEHIKDGKRIFEPTPLSEEPKPKKTKKETPKETPIEEEIETEIEVTEAEDIEPIEAIETEVIEAVDEVEAVEMQKEMF